MRDYSFVIDQLVREERERKERFEPIPLHMPVPEDDPRSQEDDEEESGGGNVIVIDYGDDEEE